MIQKLTLKKNQKGFTLIELMIVIAIIGILAAIAIPQFAAYRMRSYNASGQSDVRNLSTSEAAFFSDWQGYAVTTNAGNDTAAVIAGPSVAGTDQIGGCDTSLTVRTLDIPIGNGVSIYAAHNAAAGAQGTTFSGVAKHLQGDSVYGVDGDTTAVYGCGEGLCVARGVLLVAGDLPVAPTLADDFVAVANWITK